MHSEDCSDWADALTNPSLHCKHNIFVGFVISFHVLQLSHCFPLGIYIHGRDEVKIGDTIHLTCNVSGVTDLPQDVDWFKDGNLIRPRSREIIITKHSSVAQKSLVSTLRIRKSEIVNSGTYVCRTSDLLVSSKRVQVINGMFFTLRYPRNWQTAIAQLKCSIMQHFTRVLNVC